MSCSQGTKANKCDLSLLGSAGPSDAAKNEHQHERPEHEKPAQEKSTHELKDEAARKIKGTQDAEALQSLPTVVIRNYASSGSNKEELLEVLAQWGTSLVENKVGGDIC